MSNNINNFLQEADNTPEESNDKWMMTFADLLSLLLVFFILIYSTTSVKKSKWEKVKVTMGDSFKPLKIIEKEYTTNLNAPKIDINKGSDIDYLSAIIENKTNTDEFLRQQISIDKSGGSLIISISNQNLFKGNSPILTEDSRILLFIIGDALQLVKNKIEVVGYTKGKVKSDDMNSWNLTLSRAVKIASNMREYGNLSKLEAIVSSPDEVEKQDRYLNKVDIIVRPYIKE